MHQTRYHFLTAGKVTCRWTLSALGFSPFHLIKPQVPHITDVGAYFPRETHIKEQFRFWRKVPLFFPLFSGPLHHFVSNNEYPLFSQRSSESACPFIFALLLSNYTNDISTKVVLKLGGSSPLTQRISCLSSAAASKAQSLNEISWKHSQSKPSFSLKGGWKLNESYG